MKKNKMQILIDHRMDIFAKDNLIKRGLKITSIDNPEWGDWRVLDKYDNGIYEIRGDSGDRVLNENEFKFWAVDPCQTCSYKNEIGNCWAIKGMAIFGSVNCEYKNEVKR